MFYVFADYQDLLGPGHCQIDELLIQFAEFELY